MQNRPLHGWCLRSNPPLPLVLPPWRNGRQVFNAQDLPGRRYVSESVFDSRAALLNLFVLAIFIGVLAVRPTWAQSIKAAMCWNVPALRRATCVNCRLTSLALRLRTSKFGNASVVKGSSHRGTLVAGRATFVETTSAVRRTGHLPPHIYGHPARTRSHGHRPGSGGSQRHCLHPSPSRSQGASCLLRSAGSRLAADALQFRALIAPRRAQCSSPLPPPTAGSEFPLPQSPGSSSGAERRGLTFTY